MTQFTIYLHRNRINGKGYVGQTKRTVHEAGLKAARKRAQKKVKQMALAAINAEKD